MSVDYAHKIIQLAQPLRPVEQPGAQDWECLERDLGVSLPRDYKTLVTALGSGDFGLGLRLQNPVSSSEYTRLSAAALRHYREAVAFLEDAIGIAFFPHLEGLILIGGIDRQQLFLRPNQGRINYSQLLLLDYDLEELHDLNMSVSQFIYELCHGRILEPWARGLRKSVWADDTTPFFPVLVRHAAEPRQRAMKTVILRIVPLLGIGLAAFSCSSDGTQRGSLTPKRLPGAEEPLSQEHPLRKAFADMPSCQEQLDKFSKRVSQNLDTAVALTWAKEIAGRIQKTERISHENIPATIKRLEPQFPVFTSWGNEPGKLPLFVEWGGGFRHWGLVFSDTEETLKAFRIIYRPVTNGLYTFVSTDH